MTKDTDPATGEDELPDYEFKKWEQKNKPLCEMFGDTPISRIANFFIGSPFYSYSTSEIAELNEVTRQTTAKAIKTLIRFRMIKAIKDGKTTEYQWDTESKSAQGLHVLLRSLIEIVVEEAKEYKMTHKPPKVVEVTEHDLRLLLRGELKTMPENTVFKLKGSDDKTS